MEAAVARAQEKVTRTCIGPGLFGKGCARTFRVLPSSPEEHCSDECRPKDESKKARRSRGLGFSVGSVFAKKVKESPDTKRLRIQNAIEKSSRRAQFERDAHAAVAEAPDEVLAGIVEAAAAPAINDAPAVVTFESIVNANELEQQAEMEARWVRYIEEARPWVKKLCSDRLEVAKIAIRACRIKQGGGAHWSKFEGVYTLKRFAEEVGVNYKTLSGWVSAYRNVISKLPEGVYVDGSFETIRRIRDKVTKKTPAAEVAALYHKELGTNRDREQLTRGLKRFRTLHYFVRHKADLEKMRTETPDELALLERLCVEILDRIREAKRAN